MTTTPVLVTGATGQTGSETARLLVAAGIPVRGTIRTPDGQGRLPAGVDPIVADFDDPASIRAALTGVESAYLVTPSSEDAERQQLAFLDEAAATGVRRIVLLSQLAAEADSPVRFLRYHAVVENHLRQLDLAHTILRPNLYFQGLLAMAGQIAATDSFGAPIGDARVSAIDVRDIAAVAATVLRDPEPGNATLTLTGRRAVTHTEVAEAFSTAIGRTITFSDVPPDQFGAALQGMLPPWQLDGLLEDYAHYERGEAAEVTDTVRRITGHEPRSIADFARDYAAAFTRS